VLLWMRHDEAHPDIDLQYTEKGEAGKHKYFVFPYTWPEKSWGPLVRSLFYLLQYIQNLIDCLWFVCCV
jgi:hypothetical protein